MNDHDAIRNLIAEYTLANDDGRNADVAACFVPDGELEALGHVIRGREALTALLDGFDHSQMKHLYTNTLIKVDGERASAISDLLTLAMDPAHSWQILGCARYIDALIKVDGTWQFERRIADWHSATSPDVFSKLQNLMSGTGNSVAG